MTNKTGKPFWNKFNVKISTILDSIDSGSIGLLVLQRGHVWNRGQMRSLMRSLYSCYPVSILILWNTKPETAKGNDGGIRADRNVALLLDGQQRITALYCKTVAILPLPNSAKPLGRGSSFLIGDDSVELVAVPVVAINSSPDVVKNNDYC